MIVKTQENIAIMYPTGKMDINKTNDFENEINRVMKEYPSHDVILNFKNVDTVSSSSLRVMVTSARRLKNSEKDLIICNINDIVHKVFDIVNIEKMIQVFDSEETAVQYLQSNR